MYENRVSQNYPDKRYNTFKNDVVVKVISKKFTNFYLNLFVTYAIHSNRRDPSKELWLTVNNFHS